MARGGAAAARILDVRDSCWRWTCRRPATLRVGVWPAPYVKVGLDMSGRGLAQSPRCCRGKRPLTRPIEPDEPGGATGAPRLVRRRFDTAANQATLQPALCDVLGDLAQARDDQRPLWLSVSGDAVCDGGGRVVGMTA